MDSTFSFFAIFLPIKTVDIPCFQNSGQNSGYNILLILNVLSISKNAVHFFPRKKGEVGK